MAIYDIGDVPRIRATFTSGTPAVVVDPTTIKFKYRVPGALTTTTLTYGVDAALVKDATGIYHVDITIIIAGTWFYRWEATGSYACAEQGSFDALDSNC